MGRSGTALGLIGIIIGAVGVGFAFIAWNDQKILASDFNNLTGTIIVGIWDNLDENLNYAPHNSQGNWLFEFGDNNVTNSHYITISKTYTRISLVKSGWYRIHISVLLEGMSPSNVYWIVLYKNGVIESYLDFYETPSTIPTTYDFLKLSTFVYSNGTNYIEIVGACLSGGFQIWEVDPDYNQFTIEYVVI
jgi:hypothetical protein